MLSLPQTNQNVNKFLEVEVLAVDIHLRRRRVAEHLLRSTKPFCKKIHVKVVSGLFVEENQQRQLQMLDSEKNRSVIVKQSNMNERKLHVDS